MASPQRHSGSFPALTVCCIPLFSLALLSAGSRASAQGQQPVKQITGEERISVLNYLAAQTEANYRKIETWRGKYQFIDRTPKKIQVDLARDGHKPGKQPSPREIQFRDVIAIHEGIVTFALDAHADKLWSEYKEDGTKIRFISLDGKDTLKPFKYEPVDEREILSADVRTKFPAHHKYGPLPEYREDPNHVRNSSSRLADRDSFPSSERIETYTGQRLDPRRFYAIDNNILWEKLRRYADALAGREGPEVRDRVSGHLEITRKGAPGDYEFTMRIQYGTDSPDDNKGVPTDVARFTEKTSCLPSEATMYNPDGRSFSQFRSWIYKRVDGVLVPQEYHFIHKAVDMDRLYLDRHLTFVEAVLNEPALAADTFSTERLGLTKGDRLEDKIEKRLYVSDGKSLVSAKEYLPSVGRWSVMRWPLIIALNIGGVSGVIIWLWPRWRRASVKRETATDNAM